MNEKEIATNIVKKLQDAGHIAVFAGGCVRDQVMGRTPKDYDVATSASPDEVEELFGHTLPVGKAFGVIIVIVYNLQFEAATLRTDSDTSDGRRPDSVKYTSSLKEDASRRDFTMNAMFFDPIENKLFDFFGGVDDIQNSIIRFVGDPEKRIKEDALRMMRAIRFTVSLDFDLEVSAGQAVTKLSSSIVKISFERVKMELDKILLARNPSIGFRLLKTCGILSIILEEVNELILVDQSPKWHTEGSTWKHTMLALNEARKHTDDLDVLWGTLLHDIGKAKCSTIVEGIIKHLGHASIGAEMAEEVMNRFKASSSHRDTAVAIVKDHMRIKHASKMKRSTLRRLMAETYFDKLVTVSHADSMASTPADPEDGINKFDWLNRINEMKEELKNEVVLPKCIIGGKDLIELGLEPSPRFTTILTCIMNLQLDGVVSTREQAITVAKEMI